MVSIRRIGDRPVDREHGGCRLGADPVHGADDRIGAWRCRRLVPVDGQPQPPLPAEHAHDRADADRHVHAGDSVHGGMGRSPRGFRRTRRWLGDCGRVYDTVRGLADLRLAARPLVPGPAARRAPRPRRAAPVPAGCDLSGDCARAFQPQQPLDDRDLVRSGGILRSGERSTQSRVPRTRTGARERLSALRHGVDLVRIRWRGVDWTIGGPYAQPSPAAPGLRADGRGDRSVVRVLSGSPVQDSLRPAAGGCLLGNQRGRE